jgi:hypothetical protein
MDYFQHAGIAYDPRMEEASGYIAGKRRHDGTWRLSSAYPGKVHFAMEQAGKPGRWNTLRALRVLKYASLDNKLKCDLRVTDTAGMTNHQ